MLCVSMKCYSVFVFSLTLSFTCTLVISKECVLRLDVHGLRIYPHAPHLTLLSSLRWPVALCVLVQGRQRGSL